jgi:hypothetical protein
MAPCPEWLTDLLFSGTSDKHLNSLAIRLEAVLALLNAALPAASDKVVR